jgi:hypothetical protein
MRTLVPARLLLGSSMLLASLGLVVVGVRGLVELSASSSMASDGLPAASPAVYAAPWAVAVVLVAAGVHLVRGLRDQVL